MFISKLLKEGEDFHLEIPAEEIEAQGLSDGDWIKLQFSLPTEAEITDYFTNQSETNESDS